MKEMIQV